MWNGALEHGNIFHMNKLYICKSLFHISRAEDKQLLKKNQIEIKFSHLKVSLKNNNNILLDGFFWLKPNTVKNYYWTPISNC